MMSQTTHGFMGWKLTRMTGMNREPCTEKLKRHNVPTLNSPQNFNLEKYMAWSAPEKENAKAWGRGDFKSMIKDSMKDYKKEV